MFGGDAHHRLVPRQPDVPVLGHVDGHPERRSARALPDTGLQHPELALLDRELRVAHVAVVRLELLEDREQLFVDRRELPAERLEVLGVADACNDVFTLRVDEEVAVGLVLAGRRVASEADARTRVVIAVAEDHRLHIHRRAELVADALAHSVRDRAGAVPAAEDGFDRAAQLEHGILRERPAGRLLHDGLVLLAQVFEIGSGHLGVTLRTSGRLGLLERLVELERRDVEHDSPVHRDEAPVRVVRESLVVRLGREPAHRAIGETEVQDRVHHAGHRELRTRTHADEQRISRVAELATHLLLELGDVLGQLVGEAARPPPVHVGPAGVGGDREARRHRQAAAPRSSRRGLPPCRRAGPSCPSGRAGACGRRRTRRSRDEPTCRAFGPSRAIVPGQSCQIGRHAQCSHDAFRSWAHAARAPCSSSPLSSSPRPRSSSPLRASAQAAPGRPRRSSEGRDRRHRASDVRQVTGSRVFHPSATAAANVVARTRDARAAPALPPVHSGTYTIHETAPADENGQSVSELTSVVCDGQDIAGAGQQRAVVVTDEASITCTFTDTRHARRDPRAEDRHRRHEHVDAAGAVPHHLPSHSGSTSTSSRRSGPGGPGTYTIGQGSIPPATCTISEIDTGSDGTVEVSMIDDEPRRADHRIGTTSLTFTSHVGGRPRAHGDERASSAAIDHPFRPNNGSDVHDDRRWKHDDATTTTTVDFDHDQRRRRPAEGGDDDHARRRRDVGTHDRAVAADNRFPDGRAARRGARGDARRRRARRHGPDGSSTRPPQAEARPRSSSSTSESIGTRTCSVVSRSRIVTARSSSVSKSTVTASGVPISS